MKIGLIRETKTPVDNRVALAPTQMAALQNRYPDDKFVVQSSDTRVFSDDAYRSAGIEVRERMDDCDLLLGIKEVDVNTLISGKHYFFFGHFAKQQSSNLPLLQSLIAKKITFSDYEYLVDDQNRRLCAFGWWAGFVGTYYTLRGYGLRHGLYELPKPDRHFSMEKLLSALRAITLPPVRLLVTGNGRVSHGVQELLEQIGAERLTETAFLSESPVQKLSFCVADADRLTIRRDGTAFSWPDFLAHPDEYRSDFMRWGQRADILISAHFWNPQAPVYLTCENLADPNLGIRFIGDISCDIQGSIRSTLRASTHDEPYYDYNPATASEQPAFSSDRHITVMAVDTCPNALAADTSTYFGERLIKHVFTPLLERRHSDVIERATILRDGRLTPRFEYLTDFSKGIPQVETCHGASPQKPPKNV